MTLQQGINLIESFIKQLETMEKIALHNFDKVKLDLVRAEIGDLKHILGALKNV